MIGLLFLATVAVWLWACIWLSGKVGNNLAKPSRRIAARLVALAILISLPFVDEVIGKRQFEALCKANGIESADVSKARGKRVKVEYVGHKVPPGTILPI